MVFNVISTIPFVPAKTISLSTSNSVSILSTPCIILRPSLLSAPSPKTISAKTFAGPHRATASSTPPQKYVYPDPIPEFAEAETQKFRSELLRKLVKDKETFGDSLDMVIDTCAEILREFLHNEYGGPGTLVVEPFTDMLVALKEQKLPGAPLAARTSLLWAQNYIDEDWEIWNSNRDFSA